MAEEKPVRRRQAKPAETEKQRRVPEVFSRIRRRISRWKPEVIFDVGANAGQSAQQYSTVFPNAVIHSFEPVPATYARLVKNTRNLPKVTAHNWALGSTEGTARMAMAGFSTDNTIRAATDEVAETDVEVTLRRGDKVLAALGIDRVSFLKIDTEGHDLEVLAGFGDALSKIDFVQVEAGMNAYNTTHRPFQEFVDYLIPRDFLLFFIGDQKLEFKLGGRPVLRRANPVFIASRLVDLDGLS